MAVRSGAGTGVVVSLVVFVLTTVFLLVLAIIFYAGKAEALKDTKDAKDQLAQYVRPQQRSSDQFRAIEQGASANGQSVAAYLMSQKDELMRYVNGDATISTAQLKADLERFGVDQDSAVRHRLEELSRDLREAQVESDGDKKKVADRDEKLAEKDAQIDRMRQDHADAITEIERTTRQYGDAALEYRDEVQETKDEMVRSRDELQDQYDVRIDDLEDELDGANQQAVLLRARMSEYENVLNEMRVKAKNPAMLVDADVIDVDVANEQVFISRGKKDRIVLGMTFEVYDDAAQIRVNDRTTVMPRGKASLQVIRVGPSTSTCKIIRNIPGRPVVRGDVLANAIYDPEYRFKFLFHGKFDVDGDGRASEAETDHLRSLAIRWGGEVIDGEELPGDLDFLVLGEEPPPARLLRPDANQAQIDIWARQRAAVMKYQELMRRASEAQIPVLNANRFFVLIGHTSR